MDAAGEFVGAFFFVEEGTVNSDRFVMTTDNQFAGTSSIDGPNYRTGQSQLVMHYQNQAILKCKR